VRGIVNVNYYSDCKQVITLKEDDFLAKHLIKNLHCTYAKTQKVGKIMSGQCVHIDTAKWYMHNGLHLLQKSQDECLHHKPQIFI